MGPQHIEFAGHDVWLRSAISGLCSLPVNVLILAPGLTDEQRQMAIEKTRCTRGVIYELRELTLDKPLPA
jgi:GTPase